MPTVRYNVIDPPTSGEVADRALFVLGESGVLDLVVRAAEQEVPAPTDQPLSFPIRRTGHPAKGGMRIVGFTDPDNRYVTVTTSPDAGAPATAEITTA